QTAVPILQWAASQFFPGDVREISSEMKIHERWSPAMTIANAFKLNDAARTDAKTQPREVFFNALNRRVDFPHGVFAPPWHTKKHKPLAAARKSPSRLDFRVRYLA